MTAVRVLMHLLRKISLFRRVWFLRYILRRVQAVVGYGLSYAICFISIYGLSFSEGVLDEGCRVARVLSLNVSYLSPSISAGLEHLMSPTDAALRSYPGIFFCFVNMCPNLVVFCMRGG